jgi:fructokinase
MALKDPHLVIGIGEMLWDIMPNDMTLGGTVANFSVMASRLGSHAVILSRIGRDDLGRKAVDWLDPLPVDASFLQVDPVHETGQVTVTLTGGQPSYVIHQPSAWDFMELTDAWMQLAERADAICFGSLSQRCQESRQTLQTLVAQTPSSCIRVFDVNLRAPFFTSEIVQESLELATVIKMNDAEVWQVLAMLGLPAEEGSPHDHLRLAAERLLDEFPALELVAVTRGGHGSLLVRRAEWHEHPGIAVKIADTIGAGDAFTAALTHYLLRGADLPTLNEAGNRWGAWVATQVGAMPPLPDSVRAAIDATIDAAE